MISVYHCSATTFERFDARIAAGDEKYTVVLPKMPRFEQEDIEQMLQVISGVVVVAQMSDSEREFAKFRNKLLQRRIEAGLWVCLAPLAANATNFVDIIRRGLASRVALFVVEDESHIDEALGSVDGVRCGDDLESLAIRQSPAKFWPTVGYIVQNEQTHVAAVIRGNRVLTRPGWEVLEESPRHLLSTWAMGKPL